MPLDGFDATAGGLWHTTNTPYIIDQPYTTAGTTMSIGYGWTPDASPDASIDYSHIQIEQLVKAINDLTARIEFIEKKLGGEF